MMGKLIWLMGPSGSGKDSLLAELRLREQTQLLVAHRYITRDASAGSENHIALSEQEFFTRAGQNLLALSWHANGLYYGVGVEIDLWLHAGFDVLVNGSRAHLPQVMVMDCSHPPRADAPRNHCDLNTVLALNQVIRSPRVILTHISHQFDAWLMENALPSGFEVGFDGMEIGVA
ncbi:ribose 1,5-bisphosphokinase [Escherichia coli]|uniref:ribose 1,5-bisphosphokinase n=1 Tax=Escherichia coli TaxID=562 RepID=UPI0017602042|nr:ribose 1,5-bisphosphokinase [Escherichia coli]HAJ6816140.1 ribose 1,5-bisphosphokinase [Escherichia coli]